MSNSIICGKSNKPYGFKNTQKKKLFLTHLLFWHISKDSTFWSTHSPEFLISEKLSYLISHLKIILGTLQKRWG